MDKIMKISVNKYKMSILGKLLYSFVFMVLFSSIGIPNSLAINNIIKSIMKFIPFSIVDEFTHMIIYSLITLIVIIYSILFAFMLIVKKGKQSISIKWPINAPIILVIFFLIVSISALYYKEYAFMFFYLFYIELILVINSLQKSDVSILKSKVLLVIEKAGTINAIFIFLQYALMSNYDFLSLGNWRIYRPVGICYDAILATLLSGFAISAILYRSQKEKLKISSVVKMIFIILAGIYTGSRTIFIIIPICFAAFIIASGTSNKNKIKLFLLAITFLIVINVALGGFLYSFFNVIQDVGFESNSRKLKADLAKRIFMDNPILGVGTNQYQYFEEMYLSSFRGINGTNPHNIYLQILAENGFLGFSLAILGVCSVWMVHLKRKQFYPLCILTLYLVVGFTLGVSGNVQFTSLCIIICGLFIKKYIEGV